MVYQARFSFPDSESSASLSYLISKLVKLSSTWMCLASAMDTMEDAVALLYEVFLPNPKISCEVAQLLYLCIQNLSASCLV